MIFTLPIENCIDKTLLTRIRHLVLANQSEPEDFPWGGSLEDFEPGSRSEEKQLVDANNRAEAARVEVSALKQRIHNLEEQLASANSLIQKAIHQLQEVQTALRTSA